MRVLIGCVVAAGLAAAGGAAVWLDDSVPLDNLPPAVTAAVREKFPAATLKEAAKETENGTVVYEVVIDDAGTRVDVNVTADGVVIGYEKAVDPAALPTPVSAAVAATHPTGTAKTAEAVYKCGTGADAVAYYEVTVEVGRRTHEVEVLPDGTLKPAEKK